jgi:hypothetical protein
MAIIWLGALFVACGILYMACAAIFRGRLSDLHSVQGKRTLEPMHRGLGFAPQHSADSTW